MKWRIWLLTFCIVLVSLLTFAVSSTYIYYNSSINDSKKYLRVYMNEFDQDRYTLDDIGAKEFSKKLDDARVTFITIDGEVMADSLYDKKDLPNHLDRDEVKKALDTGEGFKVRKSKTLSKNMIYYCRNYSNKFLIRISIFTSSQWAIFVSILPTFLIFAVIVIALCILIAALSTHFIIKPVTKLASEAISNDKVKSDYKELEPVANILNERSDNINRQMAEIQKEKEMIVAARNSKDEFIANVTHEMNTPLTSIYGYAELLNANILNDEQKEIAYTTIQKQSDRLAKLISCIINYSEIESDDLPPYEVDFSSIARESLIALKPEIDKRHIEVITDISDNVILTSRTERLDQVFGNLVRNAIKYNKDNGKIYITLSREHLIVEDTGIGIADENKDKIFSRFFTVDKSHSGKNGGFGLGLAVVKKICQKSNWTIKVESKLGVGTRFTITF